MEAEISALSGIANELKLLQHDRASGELIVVPEQQPSSTWSFYLYQGRLIYATGGSHRARRLFRAIRQHCPSAISETWLRTLGNLPEPWEFYLIGNALKQAKIDSEKAKALIVASVQEVLYTLIDRGQLQIDWKFSKQPLQPLVLLSVDQVIQHAYDAKTKWQMAGLGHIQKMMPGFSFDFAPFLALPDQLKAMVDSGSITPPTYKVLVSLLNGQNTLWDLSFKMQRSMIAVMRSLLPLIIDGIVELKEIPDLPYPPVSQQPESEPPPPKSKGLIACIDDSPLIGQEMTQILNNEGYEVIHIIDPLQGVSLLLKRKPDLIFLDLVMPNTNGYELCTFLRKTSTFQDIPIVILTGHDGVIDRVRAKMVGASDFLGKPADPVKVRQMLDKYLNQAETEN
ncbi:response regulator [Pseudanabaena sp. PCC 6802]|uniref:response regulator n=1 Tax=Pseudanabaena sp. PCC 6802 TaxID=118173 RepID=UPI000347D0F0|nr:response regulator [Pseudanabaena sp. PCC 6802]